jgi:tetratricopeptide (TPR) repeat protein
MIDYISKAGEADPGCAMAFLGLGDAYQHKFVYEDHDPEALRLMKENYARAYAMAPERAETNCGAGWVHFIEGDNDRAYAYFKKALAADPKSLHVLLEIGSFLRSIGLLEKASDYYSRVIRGGGGTADIHLLRGWTYEHMGFYESALADFDRMVKLEPTDWRPRCLRARVLILMKRYEAAASELAAAEAMEPGALTIALTRALVEAARGERDAALAAIAPERDGKRARSTIYRSRVFAKLGLADEAVAAIELGIEKGFADVHDYFFSFPFLNNTRDHFLENLRGDPRFAEILRRQELKYVENLDKYSGL